MRAFHHDCAQLIHDLPQAVEPHIPAQHRIQVPVPTVLALVLLEGTHVAPPCRQVRDAQCGVRVVVREGVGEQREWEVAEGGVLAEDTGGREEVQDWDRGVLAIGGVVSLAALAVGVMHVEGS
jgi:hypothetical protein